MKIHEILIIIFKDEDGATMVEYAIMVGFIAAVCASAIALLGPAVASLFAPVPPAIGGS